MSTRDRQQTKVVSLGGFPPEHHVSRDLGVSFRFISREETETTARITEPLRHPDGTLRSEVLLTLLDEAAASAAVFTALPDWMSTLDTSVGLLPVQVHDRLVIRTTTVRAGRRVIVLASEATSGELRVGWASVAFARVPQEGVAASFDLETPDATAVFDLALEGSGFVSPLHEAIGFRVAEDDSRTCELPFGPYVANTAGVLHGGVAVGAAALAAETASRNPARTAAAHCRFLTPGTVGPFRYRVRPLGADRSLVTHQVEAVDTGDDDRVMAVATITTVPR